VQLRTLYNEGVLAYKSKRIVLQRNARREIPSSKILNIASYFDPIHIGLLKAILDHQVTRWKCRLLCDRVRDFAQYVQFQSWCFLSLESWSWIRRLFAEGQCIESSRNCCVPADHCRSESSRALRNSFL